MIIALAITTGIALGLMAGGDLRRLAHARIRGEGVLLVTLVFQIAVPMLLSAIRVSAMWVWIVWVGSFLLMACIASANLGHPGFSAITCGTVANAAVVSLNRGMPVSLEAMRYAGYAGSLDDLPTVLSGPTHHLVDDSGLALLLGDIMPLPGPGLWRAAVSLGDVLLVCGVIAFVFATTTSRKIEVRGARS